MITKAHQNYHNANVSTADRGKLVVMIYDHCLKWLRRAGEEKSSGNVEKMNKAIQKVQDGITELMCSLNMEAGGDLAQNLFRLYDFYSWHLTEAIRTGISSSSSDAPVEEITRMMASLREAWVVAIENVRKEDRTKLNEKVPSQLSMVG